MTQPISTMTDGVAPATADRIEISRQVGGVWTTLRLDLGQMASFGALTLAADKGLYATGAGALATYDLTAGGRALGGVAGTSGTFPYFSASNVVSLATITAAGRALLDDADAATQRGTLELGSMATQAASAVAITGGSAFGLGGVQITGAVAPTTGSGLEIQGGATVAMAAYNRGSSSYISANFDASVFNFRPNGSTKLSVNTTQVVASGSLKLPSYTVGTLPSAATHGAGAQIYVTDETGGPVEAVSDGTNWRRSTDRAVVS